MTMKVTAAFAVLLALTLAVIPAGTGAVTPTATGASQGGQTTVRALFPTTAQQGYEILVANFERVFPNINIETQFLPSDTLGQLLITQLQAGNAPDVVHLQTGALSAAGVWPLAQQGKLLDLSNRPWVKRILPSAKPTASWNGKVYAWPLTMGPFGVVYNAELFQQLNLKVPANMSEVLTMCRRIKDAGKIPFVQAWGANTTGSIVGRQRYHQYVYSVDPKWDQKRARKQVTFTGSALWRGALGSIVRMKNAGCFQEGATGTSRAQQYALFAQGQSVMSIVSSGEVTNIKTINPNIKVGWMNLPGASAKNSILVAPFSLNLGITKATKQPVAARTFVDFMARQQQSSLFAKVASSIAPLDAKQGRLPAEMKGLLPFFRSGKITSAYDNRWKDPRIYNEGYVLGIMGLMTGQRTIDAVLKKMDELYDAS